METVSQEVVDTARREVEGLTPATAARVMTRIREAQPDVLGFVLSETRDLPRPVRVRAELGAVLVRPSEQLVADLERVCGVGAVKLR